MTLYRRYAINSMAAGVSGTRDFTVASETGTPVAYRVWATRATGLGPPGSNHAHFSCGMGDGTNERCTSGGSENGTSTNTDTFRGRYTNRSIHLHNVANKNTDCVGVFDSFITGGVRFDFTNPLGVAAYVTVELWFGDLTPVVGTAVLDQSEDAEKDFTGLGIDPDILYGMSVALAGTGNYNHFRVMQGVAHRGPFGEISQACQSMHDEDNEIRSEVAAWIGSDSTRFLQGVDIDDVIVDSVLTQVAAIKVGAEITSWTSGGFGVTKRDAATNLTMDYLALEFTDRMGHGIVIEDTPNSGTPTETYDTQVVSGTGEVIRGTPESCSGLGILGNQADHDTLLDGDDAGSIWVYWGGNTSETVCSGVFINADDPVPVVTRSIASGTSAFWPNAAGSDSVTFTVDAFSLGEVDINYSNTLVNACSIVFDYITEEEIFIGKDGAGTLPKLEASAAGTLEFTGTEAGTLPKLEASATGTLEFTGTEAGTLPKLEASATGTITTGPTSITGTATGTVPLPESSSLGRLEFTASGSGLLPLAVSAASGQVGVDVSLCGSIASLDENPILVTVADSVYTVSENSIEITVNMDHIDIVVVTGPGPIDVTVSDDTISVEVCE